ncbi:MAG: porin family protein [Bacteroidota bacterium]|jgi:hypothetical protein|nr:porin family protein [Cytophagales bacterium]
MKNILLFFFLCFVQFLCSAQSISGGIRIGLNLAQSSQSATVSGNVFGSPVNLSQSLTSDTRVGFTAGTFLTFMFNKELGLQPELVYNSNGYKIQSTTVTTNYLSLPVFIRYNINQNFHLLGGPQLGYLLSAEANDPTFSPVQSGSPSQSSLKDQLNSLDFGFTFGLGVDIQKFNIGVRYNLGIANTIKDSKGSLQGLNYEIKAVNLGWQFVVGAKIFGQ